jgi:uncharacterized protein
MIVHIDQLQQPLEFSLEVESQHCHLPSDIGEYLEPIHFDAHVRKVEEKVFITGRISAHIKMNCARCLQPHEERIDDTFEATYLPQPDIQEKEEEIELEEIDLDVSYYTGNSIALYDVLREQLLLLIPLKPLCKPDCAGLCPSCGKDLNTGTCHCNRRSVDPRLAVLEQLLHKDLEEKNHGCTKEKNIKIQTQ